MIKYINGVFRVLFIAYWLFGMHFFMHNPGGAGLYLPFNAWGWVFASLAIGLGLWQVTLRQRLVFSPLQVGLWIGALLLLLPMLYPGFCAQGLRHSPIAGAVYRAAVSIWALSVALSSAAA